MRAIIFYMWWSNLKDRIRSFAADYSRRYNLDTIVEQSLLEDKQDRFDNAGDSGATDIAKAELASFQIKK